MGKRKKLTRRQKREASKMTDKKIDKKKSNYDPSNFTVTKSKPKWQYTPKPPCHTGQPLVFTTDTGINVYAGGKNRSGGWHKMDFVPDLAMGPDETLVYSLKSNDRTVVPEGFTCGEHVTKPLTPPPIIALDFPDFGIPKVGPQFWYALASDIIDLELKNISVQCAGGHGRTGVQLAILYDLLNTHSGGKPYTNVGDLILMLRDMYCSHIVETTDQQQYIADVIGMPVGDNVIEDRYGGFYSGGGGLGKGVTFTPTSDVFSDDVEWEELLDDDYKVIQAYEICGMCGQKSWFDDTESYCEICLEPYLKAEENAQNAPAVVCPSCECEDTAMTSVDKDGSVVACDNCGWFKPDKNAEAKVCYSCGNEYAPHHFTMHDPDTCMQCLATDMRIKHDQKGVQCVLCKKVKDNEYIHDYHPTEKGFICRGCY